MTDTAETKYHFQFDLPPFGKERPRMTVMGRGKRSFVKAYTPPKTVAYESAVKAATLEQMSENGISLIPSDRPIHINCVFCMPRSKAQTSSQYHTKTPDIDNLLKSILDGLQGALLEDDKSVVSISVTKRYSGLDGYVGTLLSVTLLPISEKSEHAKPRTRKASTDAPSKDGPIEYPVTTVPVSKTLQPTRRRAANANKRKKQARKANG